MEPMRSDGNILGGDPQALDPLGLGHPQQLPGGEHELAGAVAAAHQDFGQRKDGVVDVHGHVRRKANSHHAANVVVVFLFQSKYQHWRLLL